MQVRRKQSLNVRIFFFYSNNDQEMGLAFHFRLLYIAYVSKYKILLLQIRQWVSPLERGSSEPVACLYSWRREIPGCCQCLPTLNQLNPSNFRCPIGNVGTQLDRWREDNSRSLESESDMLQEDTNSFGNATHVELPVCRVRSTFGTMERSTEVIVQQIQESIPCFFKVLVAHRIDGSTVR